jgi:hypothetical protein
MRIPKLLTTVLAIVLLVVVVAVVWTAANGDPRLLRDVEFSHTSISPNADGHDDALVITYWLNRNATVSIYFVAADGQRYDFRRDEPRSRSLDEAYRVLFSGVVDGYRRADDVFQGEILARLMPDGDYRWVVAATGEAGDHEEITGTLTIAGADTALPELRAFTVSPPVITPNRDGLSDRATINYYLSKEAESVIVYLLSPDGLQRYDIPEKETVNPAGATGQHTYDYAAGVDDGAQPPPDGAYTVYAVAADLEGQRVRVTNTLTIQDGGVPRADIVAPAAGDQIEFSSVSAVIGDTLYFTATVDNFGEVPIRTTGPWPGTCYDLDQNFNTLGFTDESGAWRFGMDYETSPRNYPFRWGVGRPEDLLTQVINGDTFYFLPAHRRSLVTGCIRLTAVPERNPLYFWGGLIHQDVEVAQFNNQVDPHLVTIGKP